VSAADRGLAKPRVLFSTRLRFVPVAMAKATQDVSKKFRQGVALRFLCRGRWNLQVTTLRDLLSVRVAGRFVALWLTILFLCRPHVTFSAESLPPLPKLYLQQFLPAVREQVQEAYDAVVAHPRNAAANGKLGMVLQAYSQLEGAETAYRRAHQLAPSHFDWIYYLGRTQADQGNCDGAIKSLRKALTLNPGYLPARLKVAECLRSSAQWEESETLYKAILKDHVDSAEAYYGLGKVQAAQHEVRAAIDSYRAACKLFPEFGAAYYALALAYRTIEEEEKAREEFENYEKNKDTAPPARDPLVGEMHALNRSATIQIRAGFDLERAGKLQEAAEAHERALKIDPTMVQAHVNLISIYGRLNELEKAEHHYHKAVQLAPEEEGAHYDYGVLMTGAGRYEEAEKAFRKALEINPSHAEAHNNLGVLLEQRGLLADAEVEFQKAVEQEPGYRLAHFHLGRLLVNRRDFSAGIQHLLKTIAPEDDSTPGYLYALGAAYARAGDREKAIQYLREGRAKAQTRGQHQLVERIESDLKTLGSQANSH
jgi:tetratricopeptide (TPR) repeat protein